MYILEQERTFLSREQAYFVSDPMANHAVGAANTFAVDEELGAGGERIQEPSCSEDEEMGSE